MKIITFLSVIFLTYPVMASEADKYIKSGIQFHDKGKYEEASRQYKKALEIEPENSMALYELAFTYMRAKKNKECIEVAQKGLKLKSKLQKKFNITLGSCYSQNGNINEALKSFENGIKVDSKDPYLHLNIAVTLINIGKKQRAVLHLKEAIKFANGYASPYYFLAEIFRNSNYKIPAMFLYMKFVSLEPNSQRSVDASKKSIHFYMMGLRKIIQQI